MNTNSADEKSRSMLKVIREFQSYDKKENNTNGSVAIQRNDNRFGELRRNQETQIIKTIDANVVFKDNALMFYPDKEDLSLNGDVPSLNMKFQFRLDAPSGEGCYIWANGLQLTDANTRSIGKLHDAFVNWKQQLIEESDILKKMKQELSNGE